MSTLKVNTIADPDNGNTAITIDSSGNATFAQNLSITGNLSGDGSNLTGISSSGGASMFRAIMNTTQSYNNNTNTKVNFDTEDWDLDSTYDTTNKRWTPTTAGYYQVNLSIEKGLSSDRKYYLSAQLWKNGSQHRDNVITPLTHDGNKQWVNNLSTIVYMNGTTDYLEAYSYVYDYNFQSGETIKDSAFRTYFEGYLVREA